MGDENSIGSASTSNLTAGSSDSTIEINVKTLESQIHQFRVDRNVSVPSLKEKVASAIGVPIEQQRLIFRGKVLKDDHLLSQYHVEDGHTLHLVVRQPVQSQNPTGTNSGETNRNTDNRGNDSNTAPPRSRVGVSRSVVLGSFNVGDQVGDASGANLSQIIGAVLNSFGVGNQNQAGGANNLPPGMHASHGVETNGTRSNVGGSSETGNQVPPGQTFANQTFQTLRQSLPFPLTGASAVVPSHQMPIPDALHTLSEFIDRMETALSATGYWPNPSPGSADDPQRADLPTNGRGVPTPEALSIVLRRAQQLLSGHAVAALSHVAGRLEGEGGTTDPAVRNQIQTESVQVGLAILHLGSLLLELGRTILTLRMGQSAAESLVNAGPAVYISSSGPNPIMVQPFALQASSLFGGSSPPLQANPGIINPVGPVDALRNVNIHIHAVGTRAPPPNGENPNPNPNPEPSNGPRPGPPGSSWQVPLRNIFQPRGPNNQTQTAPPQTQPPPGNQVEETTPSGLRDPEPVVNETNIPSSSGTTSKGPLDDTEKGGVPLGLGLGGLQPKRRPKPKTNPNQETIATGQQVLQSLISRAPRDSNGPPEEVNPVSTDSRAQPDVAVMMSQVLNSPALNGLLSGVSEQTGMGSPDGLRNMLEQFTQSPSMRNTLNQLVQQIDGQDGQEISNIPSTGGGGGGGGGLDLSRMVQQMMPIVSQALNGGGRQSGGGGGGFDFSRMMQQMMPLVSQALNSVGPAESSYDLLQSGAGQEVRAEVPNQNSSEIAERIERDDPPGEIFRAVAERAASLYGESGAQDLVEELCRNEDLANEFMEMVHRNMHQRL